MPYWKSPEMSGGNYAVVLYNQIPDLSWHAASCDWELLNMSHGYSNFVFINLPNNNNNNAYYLAERLSKNDPLKHPVLHIIRNILDKCIYYSAISTALLSEKNKCWLNIKSAVDSIITGYFLTTKSHTTGVPVTHYVTHLCQNKYQPFLGNGSMNRFMNKERLNIDNRFLLPVWCVHHVWCLNLTWSLENQYHHKTV